jgi:zinc transport system substrate-binding protein
MKPTRTLISAAVGATALLGVTGCDAGSANGSDDRLAVLASFYPLQYVASQVGGDLVEVTSLTPPGAEPHDVELSPSQVRELGEADVLVYLSGFQAAVDDAVTARTPANVVDAAQTPAVAEAMAGHGADPTEEGSGEDQHEQGGLDPHFWLDPTLLAAVAPDVAVMLAQADPDNADAYTARAEALVAELTTLDEDFTAGLAQCDQSVIVTAHAAFGYLTERYGLDQVGLSGLDPEAEPSPARLREIRDVVQENGVTTVFTEALVSPSVAETLADDLGITTALLDPVESQVDPEVDYRGAMEQNLVALRDALGCA